MTDLVDRLRAKAALTVKPHAPHSAGDVKHYVYDAETRGLLTEAAAALEAARVDASNMATDAMLLRKDAERYRWLRDCDAEGEQRVMTADGRELMTCEELDAAIDAAIDAARGAA